MGVSIIALIEERRIPLVSMRASEYGSRGSTVLHGSSSLRVGPRKYPWSMGRISERPVLGLRIRDNRFFIPQSNEVNPTTP
jgi:hypothetical protein